MGRRQRYVYHILPEVFPEDFPDRLDRFRRAAGFTWGGLSRELRVNARTVRRWKAGSKVGSGHLVSLFALAAGFEGWISGATAAWERILLVAGGFVMIFPHPMTLSLGAAAVILAIVAHLVRVKAFRGEPASP